MAILAILSLVVAAVALAVSVSALRISSRLQRAQLKEIEGARVLRKKADVRVSLVPGGKTERFAIENVGQGESHDVDLEVTPVDGKSSPLVEGDYDVKLPIPHLLPGSRVELIAALHMGSGVVFDTKLQWQDEDGSQREREERVSLQSV